VTITSGATGTGSGPVVFVVAANTGPARSANLTIATQAFTVNQDAAPPPPPPCAFTVVPLTANVVAAGGSGILTISVTTTSTCAWAATANDPWLTVTTGASGTGSGGVVVNIAQNNGPQRTGSLTVAAQTVTVTQNGAGVSASGVVAALTGSCPNILFIVDTTAVQTNSSTNFVGVGCGNLENGTAVAVQGVVQPDTTVLATQVTVQREL
jgi:hypothetical protein